MKAEFFSPNEDVILQNEAPSDFYIIVNGSVVSCKENLIHRLKKFIVYIAVMSPDLMT